MERIGCRREVWSLDLTVCWTRATQHHTKYDQTKQNTLTLSAPSVFFLFLHYFSIIYSLKQCGQMSHIQCHFADIRLFYNLTNLLGPKKFIRINSFLLSTNIHIKLFGNLQLTHKLSYYNYSFYNIVLIVIIRV